jgi:hypothetical protein
VVRLDVAIETVRERLAARDGLHLDDTQLRDLLAFASESSLNDWPTFDLRFVNEHGTEAGIEAIITHLVDMHGLVSSSNGRLAA